MWHESAEYKYLPLSIDPAAYRIHRDIYKAERIYSMYGYEYFANFVKQCPHIGGLLDSYVPCMSITQGQCTVFCHKYSLEKGCTLNATK